MKEIHEYQIFMTLKLNFNINSSSEKFALQYQKPKPKQNNSHILIKLNVYLLRAKNPLISKKYSFIQRGNNLFEYQNFNHGCCRLSPPLCFVQLFFFLICNNNFLSLIFILKPLCLITRSCHFLQP